jgi:glycine hydroxymethyltransferase
MLDYEEIKKLALEHRPKLILTGATAYPRIIDFDKFKMIADEAGAYLMVDMAHIAGLVAAGAHPSPVPHADVVTTTTHKTLRGPRAGMILCREKYAKKIDKAVFPGLQGGPLMHVIAAKAVALKEAMTEDFRKVQHQTVKNARALAAALADEGFRIVSGGTDNHLILVDLTNHKITGLDAQRALDGVRMTVNRNTIPFDRQNPFVTSGIRLGANAVTSRGMKEPEMKVIAGMISRVLKNPDKDSIHAEVEYEARELARAFPIYEDLFY